MRSGSEFDHNRVDLTSAQGKRESGVHGNFGDRRALPSTPPSVAKVSLADVTVLITNKTKHEIKSSPAT